MAEGKKSACACAENQVAFDYILEKAKMFKENSLNAHAQVALLKAAKSIQKYPLPIKTMEVALGLNGVGQNIAKDIMRALSKPTEAEVELKMKAQAA